VGIMQPSGGAGLRRMVRPSERVIEWPEARTAVEGRMRCLADYMGARAAGEGRRG